MYELYEQIKILRYTESKLDLKPVSTSPAGYRDALFITKVKAMARIGELNRQIYSKKLK